MERNVTQEIEALLLVLAQFRPDPDGEEEFVIQPEFERLRDASERARALLGLRWSATTYPFTAELVPMRNGVGDEDVEDQE